MNLSCICVGIIGSGNMGHTQAKFFSIIENCHLIGFADSDKNRALQLAREFNVRAFESPEDLLEDSSINLVYIAVPHRFLAYYGIHAAQKGKNVFLEKPMSASLKEAKILVKICKERNLALAVDEQTIFDPWGIKVREIIHKPNFGKVYGLVSMGGGMSFFPGYPAWQGQMDMGGGIGWNWGSHSLYHSLWMLRTRVKEVYADYGTFIHDIDAEDNITFLLRTENDIMIILRISCSSMSESFFELWSSNHQLTTKDGKLYQCKVIKRTRIAPTWEEIAIPEKKEKAYYLMDKALIDALINGIKPPVSGDDYVHVVEILEAAYRSKKEGRKVILSEESDF